MSRRLHALRTAALSAAVALLAATAARADAVNYGDLEALFGEPVTTSATGHPQRASNAPANMEIITADEIRRSGAKDIPGVLRHVGGLDVNEWSAGQTEVSVRGYVEPYAARLLVLIDGRQVYAEQYGFTPWNALPVELSEIRQIEVVKGPSTALFGFNAVGGVVNIVTYRPEHDDVKTASAGFGTQDRVQGALVHTFSVADGVGFRLSLGSSRGEEYDTPADPRLVDQRPKDVDRDSVAIDVGIDFSETVDLRLTASRVEASRNDIVRGMNLLGVDYTITSYLGRLSADTPAGLVKATLYTNVLNYENIGGTGFGDITFENDLTVAQLEDVITVARSHTLRGAVEYRRSTIGTLPFEGGEIAYDIASASAMWSWQVTPSVSLTNAVRYDQLDLERSGPVPATYPFTNADWDRTIAVTSFNSGLVWQATDRDTVRLMAGRGFQLPNLINLGATLISTPTVNATGVPTLDPSTTDNVEIAWRRAVDAINGAFDVSLFYQTNSDQTGAYDAFIPSGPALYIAPANISGSESVGLELGVEGAVGDAWRWSLDYRAQTIDDDFVTPLGGPSAWTNYEDTTPEHLVVAGLGWSGGRWEIDGYLRHQSDVQAPIPGPVFGLSTTPVDAFTALDGRVGFAITDRATFEISGQNLGQSEQRQTSAPDVERRVMGVLTVRY